MIRMIRRMFNASADRAANANCTKALENAERADARAADWARRYDDFDAFGPNPVFLDWMRDERENAAFWRSMAQKFSAQAAALA